MYRFEPVADIGKRTAHDNGHGIIQVRGSYFRFYGYGDQLAFGLIQLVLFIH